MMRVKKSILKQGFLLFLSFAAVRTVASAPESDTDPVERQVQELIQVTRGLRVGLITNPTGVDNQARLIADRLIETPDTRLVCFFAPEHGVRGDHQAGAQVADYVDIPTSRPVYTLYGARKGPTAEHLAQVDTLIFDIQDVGARFYTYVWTMTYAMEAAAAAGKRFIVFDRPNPLGAVRVEGPPNRKDMGLIGRKWPRAATGAPIRHGMTAGELARLVNEEWMRPRVRLTIIKIPGYGRRDPFEANGRLWVAPSPNMPSLNTARVYPGACLFEGTNFSEGRGTTQPFEFIGAPGMDGVIWARRLNAQGLPGVRFRPVFFVPTFSKHQGVSCGGVQIHVTDPERFAPIRTALYMLQSLIRDYPDMIEFNASLDRLSGVDDLAGRLRSESVEAIIASWQDDRKAFETLRSRYLIYGAE